MTTPCRYPTLLSSRSGKGALSKPPYWARVIQQSVVIKPEGVVKVDFFGDVSKWISAKSTERSLFPIKKGELNFTHIPFLCAMVYFYSPKYFCKNVGILTKAVMFAPNSSFSVAIIIISTVVLAYAEMLKMLAD